MYLSLSLSLSLSLCSLNVFQIVFVFVFVFVIVFFWSGHVSSSLRSNVSKVTGLSGCSLYLKSKSTVSQSVSESVTRSPIELFWTAKKEIVKKRLNFRKENKNSLATLLSDWSPKTTTLNQNSPHPWSASTYLNPFQLKSSICSMPMFASTPVLFS